MERLSKSIENILSHPGYWIGGGSSSILVLALTLSMMQSGNQYATLITNISYATSLVIILLLVAMVVKYGRMISTDVYVGLKAIIWIGVLGYLNISAWLLVLLLSASGLSAAVSKMKSVGSPVDNYLNWLDKRYNS